MRGNTAQPPQEPRTTTPNKTLLEEGEEEWEEGEGTGSAGRGVVEEEYNEDGDRAGSG